ncbi:MAG: MarR family winged helix-turn-helix transcriptional regulator [Rhodoglobus sp.]
MSDRAAAVNAWEALFRAQVTVLRELHAEFPTGEISLNEYDVLFNLSRQPERQLRMRDLNRHLLLSQPSVSRLVDRLTAKGLLRKEADPGDGRGTVVCLTDDGFALFRAVALPHSASIRRQMAALSSEELATLTALTDKLRLGIER